VKTDLFDFHLPARLIATEPANPRDAARMLVVKEGLEDSNISNFPDFLQPGDVVVLNDTKVIPARLMGKRGEASIEINLHKRVSETCWQVFARPAKRLKKDDTIVFGEDFTATVVHKSETGEIELVFHTGHFYQSLEKYGSMPLPPYMKKEATSQDKQDYQTVFARKEGAVAAPTAGLHFTQKLLERIVEKGVEIVYVTLHVGAGTFLPVKSEDTQDHIMHSEYAEISEASANIINQAKRKGHRIIAVGTTSMRVLESAAREQGIIQPFADQTSIFITPGYQFKIVDILLTNFHLPRSTLFMLVSAFCGLEVMKQAYHHAIASNYRFYSYGDACLLFGK